MLCVACLLEYAIVMTSYYYHGLYFHPTRLHVDLRSIDCGLCNRHDPEFANCGYYRHYRLFQTGKYEVNHFDSDVALLGKFYLQRSHYDSYARGMNHFDSEIALPDNLYHWLSHCDSYACPSDHFDHSGEGRVMNLNQK